MHDPQETFKIQLFTKFSLKNNLLSRNDLQDSYCTCFLKVSWKPQKLKQALFKPLPFQYLGSTNTDWQTFDGIVSWALTLLIPTNFLNYDLGINMEAI